MELALDQAQTAANQDEVPVGCVIVSLDRGIIASGHNQRELLKDPTAHAEMIAITQAAQALSSWRLENCVLYVTLEPCPMCAGAMVLARLPMVVYGTTDPKAGACDTLYRITADPRLNHRAQVVGGVLAGRCGSPEPFSLATTSMKLPLLITESRRRQLQLPFLVDAGPDRSLARPTILAAQGCRDG
jgi:tRNA(adenine34) deaminase